MIIVSGFLVFALALPVSKIDVRCAAYQTLEEVTAEVSAKRLRDSQGDMRDVAIVERRIRQIDRMLETGIQECGPNAKDIEPTASELSSAQMERDAASLDGVADSIASDIKPSDD